MAKNASLHPCKLLQQEFLYLLDKQTAPVLQNFWEILKDKKYRNFCSLPGCGSIYKQVKLMGEVTVKNGQNIMFLHAHACFVHDPVLNWTLKRM